MPAPGNRAGRVRGLPAPFHRMSEEPTNEPCRVTSQGGRAGLRDAARRAGLCAEPGTAPDLTTRIRLTAVEYGEPAGNAGCKS